MSDAKNELEKRRALALATIQNRYGAPEGEQNVTLFVSHHLEELTSEYWLQHCGTSNPDAKQILSLLETLPEINEDEDIDLLDFTLPDEVTNYLISVAFTEAGEIESIDMES